MKHKTTLQAWMTNNGYTNRTLAEKMDFSYEYIYKFATGKVEMRPTFKWRFVEVFGWDEANKVFDAIAQPRVAEVA